jgi:hypothetical protein
MSFIEKTGRKPSEEDSKDMWNYISILRDNQGVGADCVFWGADNRDFVIVEMVDERYKTGGFGKTVSKQSEPSWRGISDRLPWMISHPRRSISHDL